MAKLLLYLLSKKLKSLNLDLVATSINSYELQNITGTSTVVQNSTNLVIGEKANFQKLKVTLDGSEEKIYFQLK